MFGEKVEIKQMRGGEGSVFIERSTILPLNCKMYARITILPNSSIGMHVHEDDEEVVYILDGSGLAFIDDEFRPVIKDEAHIVKKGRRHSIVNNSNNDLIILAIINK